MALNPKYIDSTGVMSNHPLVSDGLKGVIYGDPYISTSGGAITGTLTVNGADVLTTTGGAIIGDLGITGALTVNTHNVLTDAGGSITGDLAITGNLTINGVTVTPGAQPYTYDPVYKCLVFTS